MTFSNFSQFKEFFCRLSLKLLPALPTTHPLVSQVEIEVHESLVGALIGPAGKSIVEMQHFTGTSMLTVRRQKKGGRGNH
jgi:hypothetical protein